MRIGYVALIAVVVTMFLSACSESTAPQNPVGTWNLSTINGQSLPVSVDNVTILSETLTLNRNRTFSLARRIQNSEKTFTYTADGSWSQTSANIIIGDVPASLSNTTLEVQWGYQATGVYTR
jgi:hypothetical protein